MFREASTIGFPDTVPTAASSRRRFLRPSTVNGGATPPRDLSFLGTGRDRCSWAAASTPNEIFDPLSAQDCSQLEQRLRMRSAETRIPLNAFRSRLRSRSWGLLMPSPPPAPLPGTNSLGANLSQYHQAPLLQRWITISATRTRSRSIGPLTGTDSALFHAPTATPTVCRRKSA